MAKLIFLKMGVHPPQENERALLSLAFPTRDLSTIDPPMAFYGDDDTIPGSDHRTQPMAIILAAGQGTRMRSTLPKVAHPLRGKPLLHYVLNAALESHCDPILVVTGYQATVVESIVAVWYQSIDPLIRPQLHYVRQDSQQGTGHAVVPCLRFLVGNLNWQRPVMILSGDVPMITSRTLLEMLKYHLENLADITVLTANLGNPEGYGRIVRHGHCPELITNIVEQKDLSPEMATSTEINTGTYIAGGSTLLGTVPKINNHNRAGEYYLTDIVAIAHNQGEAVFSYPLDDVSQIAGINTPEQLAAMEEQFARSSS